jgi:hypothetical protein
MITQMGKLAWINLESYPLPLSANSTQSPARFAETTIDTFPPVAALEIFHILSCQLLALIN